MREMASELRVILRGLLKRPGYTGLALLTIVLGVGAVTASWGLLHEVVLRPLPFEESERLTVVRSRYGADLIGITHGQYRHLRENQRSYEGLAALMEPHLDSRLTWTGLDAPEFLDAVRVTPGFFRVLGVRPAMGAGFGERESGEREVMVTRRFWRSRLGADPGVVGTTLEIDGAPHTVVGVLPTDFEFPLGVEPTDVWVAYRPAPNAWASDAAALRVVGRLATGVTRDQARRATLRTLEEFQASRPPVEGFRGFAVRSLDEDLVGSARRPLVLLLLGAGLVLLVASINLSMLITARNVDRRTELRVRAALGAGRGRLLRQLLTEAGVLAVVGGAAAVLVASEVLELVFRTRAGGLQRLADASVGPEIVGIGLLAALLPALVAAAVPALRVASALRGLGERGSAGGRSSRRLAGLLTGVESGLVFALLAVTTLLLGSLREVTRVEPGFEPSSAVALELRLPQGEYDELAEFGDFVQTLEERVAGLPGVRAAGTISNLPLNPASWSGAFAVEGREYASSEAVPSVDWEVAGPGYFEAAGIPVIQGRPFTADDRADTEPVAIINETLARRWWPDGDPVGARVSGTGSEGPWRTVVGVVGDVKQQGLAQETRGFLYVPALQSFPWPERQLVVRSAGIEATAVVPRVREALRALEPDLTVGAVRPLESLVRASSESFRLRAVLFVLFGSMALLLGMAGIYGVAAHGVRSRRRAIGIRMAVGADGGTVVRTVLREGVLPVVVGVVGGLLAVLGLSPALEGLLFGVRPAEPWVLALVGGLLLVAGAAAVLPPALRARHVDPVTMLREE